MADNVIIYWVGCRGVLYAANMVTRTYVAMSSMDKVEAARRALDWAGIPHKDWGRGEPAGMEEFGVEIINEREIRDQLFTKGEEGRVAAQSAADHAGNSEVHAGEARRMLGVLLGWNQGSPGSNEEPALAALRTYLFSCVIDKDTGWWYAVAPGRFWHLENMTEVNTLRAARVMTDRQETMEHGAIVRLRDLVLRENGAVGDVPPPATYTVVSGDTLSGIAVKTGKSVADLQAWNGIADPNSINVGQVLKLGPQ